jgi:hypothetical protein
LVESRPRNFKRRKNSNHSICQSSPDSKPDGLPEDSPNIEGMHGPVLCRLI